MITERSFMGSNPLKTLGLKKIGAGFAAVLLLAGCQTTDQAAGNMAGGKAAPRSYEPIQFTAAETNPDRLRVMQPAKVVELIGEPSFQRRDLSVMVWQYRAQDCVMDLFWYDTDAGPELMYYEARAENLAHPATEATSCFTGLLTKRIQSQES